MDPSFNSMSTNSDQFFQLQNLQQKVLPSPQLLISPTQPLLSPTYPLLSPTQLISTQNNILTPQQQQQVLNTIQHQQLLIRKLTHKCQQQQSFISKMPLKTGNLSSKSNGDNNINNNKNNINNNNNFDESNGNNDDSYDDDLQDLSENTNSNFNNNYPNVENGNLNINNINNNNNNVDYINFELPYLPPFASYNSFQQQNVLKQQYNPQLQQCNQNQPYISQQATPPQHNEFNKLLQQQQQQQKLQQQQLLLLLQQQQLQNILQSQSFPHKTNSTLLQNSPPNIDLNSFFANNNMLRSLDFYALSNLNNNNLCLNNFNNEINPNMVNESNPINSYNNNNNELVNNNTNNKTNNSLPDVIRQQTGNKSNPKTINKTINYNSQTNSLNRNTKTVNKMTGNKPTGSMSKWNKSLDDNEISHHEGFGTLKNNRSFRCPRNHTPLYGKIPAWWGEDDEPSDNMNKNNNNNNKNSTSNKNSNTNIEKNISTNSNVNNYNNNNNNNAYYEAFNRTGNDPAFFNNTNMNGNNSFYETFGNNNYNNHCNNDFINYDRNTNTYDNNGEEPHSFEKCFNNSPKLPFQNNQYDLIKSSSTYKNHENSNFNSFNNNNNNNNNSNNNNNNNINKMSASRRIKSPNGMKGWDLSNKTINLPKMSDRQIKDNTEHSSTETSDSIERKLPTAFIVDMNKEEEKEKDSKATNNGEREYSSSLPAFQITDRLCSFLPRSRKMSLIKRETIMKMKFVNGKEDDSKGDEGVVTEDCDDVVSEHGTYVVTDHHTSLSDDDGGCHNDGYNGDDYNSCFSVESDYNHNNDTRNEKISQQDEVFQDTILKKRKEEEKVLEESAESFYETAMLNFDSLESSLNEKFSSDGLTSENEQNKNKIEKNENNKEFEEVKSEQKRYKKEEPKTRVLRKQTFKLFSKDKICNKGNNDNNDQENTIKQGTFTRIKAKDMSVVSDSLKPEELEDKKNFLEEKDFMSDRSEKSIDTNILLGETVWKTDGIETGRSVDTELLLLESSKAIKQNEMRKLENKIEKDSQDYVENFEESNKGFVSFDVSLTENNVKNETLVRNLKSASKERKLKIDENSFRKREKNEKNNNDINEKIKNERKQTFKTSSKLNKNDKKFEIKNDHPHPTTPSTTPLSTERSLQTDLLLQPTEIIKDQLKPKVFINKKITKSPSLSDKPIKLHAKDFLVSKSKNFTSLFDCPELRDSNDMSSLSISEKSPGLSTIPETKNKIEVGKLIEDLDKRILSKSSKKERIDLSDELDSINLTPTPPLSPSICIPNSSRSKTTELSLGQEIVRMSRVNLQKDKYFVPPCKKELSNDFDVEFFDKATKSAKVTSLRHKISSSSAALPRSHSSTNSLFTDLSVRGSSFRTCSTNKPKTNHHRSEVVTLNAISKISNDIHLLSQNIIELLKWQKGAKEERDNGESLKMLKHELQDAKNKLSDIFTNLNMNGRSRKF